MERFEYALELIKEEIDFNQNKLYAIQDALSTIYNMVFVSIFLIFFIMMGIIVLLVIFSNYNMDGKNKNAKR